MEKITERSRILNVVKRFREQYARHIIGEAGYKLPFDPKATLAELEALDADAATPEDVNRIIGSDWTSSYCDECARTVPMTIVLGDARDYDSNTASVCLPCLRKALDLAEQDSE